MTLDEFRKAFTPKGTTRESAIYIGLFWSIDGFLEKYPGAFAEALPLVTLLHQLITLDREVAASPEFKAYIGAPCANDRDGKFQTGRAIRDTFETCEAIRMANRKP